LATITVRDAFGNPVPIQVREAGDGFIQGQDAILWVREAGGGDGLVPIRGDDTNGLAVNPMTLPPGAATEVGLDELLAATDGGLDDLLAKMEAVRALLDTSPTVATATLANVASSASAVTIRAAAATRRGLYVHNDSAVVLYLKYGSGALATSHSVKLYAGDFWEMPSPIYRGIVTGLWASVDGSARVTELTP
jgi:hypothetical protein